MGGYDLPRPGGRDRKQMHQNAVFRPSRKIKNDR